MAMMARQIAHLAYIHLQRAQRSSAQRLPVRTDPPGKLVNFCRYRESDGHRLISAEALEPNDGIDTLKYSPGSEATDPLPPMPYAADVLRDPPWGFIP
ncbi:MAG: hypothetical protein NZ561_10595 [Phycisphaerae bacterium]|nr:hypothetical protein [Phycisphaerae bacterium]MDW8263098.1 hypothetical protein [Phycisphaerales bacterium]